MINKKQKNQLAPLSDKTLKDLKKKFDFGNGVEITMGTTDPNTNKTNFTYHYTNKLPKLEVVTSNAKRTIEVEVMSIEEDDRKLLHLLHKETISH